MFRVKTILIILVIVAFAGGLVPAWAQDGEGGPARVGFRPDAPSYGVHGPYWVGTREFAIDPQGDRPLKGTMWYPALNPEGAPEVATYRIGIADLVGDEFDVNPARALLDAPLDTTHGPYPLFVFSSGTGSTRLYQPFILEHLASWGFVVLTVEHTGTGLRETILAAGSEEEAAREEQAIFEAVVQRVYDMKDVITYAETLTAPSGQMAGLIDMGTIVVGGHSLGANAALVMAGARLHFNADLSLPCDPNDSAFGKTCELFVPATRAEREAELRTYAGIQGAPGEMWPSLADPRVKAAVLLLPILTVSLGTDGAQSLQGPVLMVDTGDVQWNWMMGDAAWLYQNAGSAALARLSFENGSYALFADCDPKWLKDWFSSCADSVWDMARVHDLISHFATAFLLAELKGDADARAALLPDAVTFPGITYRTTLR